MCGYYRVIDIRYSDAAKLRRIYVEKTSTPAKHAWTHTPHFTLHAFAFDDEAEAQAFCAELKKTVVVV